MKTEYLQTILDMKKVFDEVYAVCDGLSDASITPTDPDSVGPDFSMNMRQVLDRELLRMSAYIV